MDEGKFFGIPSILKESAENLALKNKEIADIKEQTKASKAESTQNAKSDSKETKVSKVEKRKKEEVIEATDDKLTRLEKEVKLSSTVTDKDVTLLSNYRKIRAYQQALQLSTT
jgi:hypothetical protein